MKPFEGKTALITGSGRGIGSAIAVHFAELGADIIVNYVHNQQPADETAEKIRLLGRKVLVVRANIGKIEGLEKLFSEAKSEFGKLDFFISNAASGFNRPAMEQKEFGWEHTMNVNAKAFLFGAQLAVPTDGKSWRWKNGCHYQSRRGTCPTGLCGCWRKQSSIKFAG